MARFLLNDAPVDLDLPDGTALLDALRGSLRLVGTKEGCREGDCGACAVLLGAPEAEDVRYRAVCACLVPLGDVDGRHVVTIEGLRGDGLSPVQQALVDGGGIQCGFCAPGLVVALTGHLLEAARLDDEAALASLAGNLCRCTGYAGIRRAVALLVARLPELGAPGTERLARLIELGVVPGHFATAARRLAELRHSAEPAVPDDGALPVGGGTDLWVGRADELRPRRLRFLGREERLRGVARDGHRLRVGAATTVAELAESPDLAACFPALRAALALFASPLIRNRATVAGNLVNASPIGDPTIALLALGARVVAAKGEMLRVFPLENLYLGYKSLALLPGEILERVDLPIPAPGTSFNFEKVSRRRLLDIASVNSALAVTVDRGTIVSARLSAGGVAPVPLLLVESSRELIGRPLDPATVRAAAARARAEIAPIDDVRGSAAYKALLLERLVVAHFAALFPGAIAPTVEAAP